MVQEGQTGFPLGEVRLSLNDGVPEALIYVVELCVWSPCWECGGMAELGGVARYQVGGR